MRLEQEGRLVVGERRDHRDREAKLVEDLATLVLRPAGEELPVAPEDVAGDEGDPAPAGRAGPTR